MASGFGCRHPWIRCHCANCLPDADRGLADANRRHDPDANHGFADANRCHDSDANHGFADANRCHDSNADHGFADANRCHDADANHGLADANRCHDTNADRCRDTDHGAYCDPGRSAAGAGNRGTRGRNSVALAGGTGCTWWLVDLGAQDAGLIGQPTAQASVSARQSASTQLARSRSANRIGSPPNPSAETLRHKRRTHSMIQPDASTSSQGRA